MGAGIGKEGLRGSATGDCGLSQGCVVPNRKGPPRLPLLNRSVGRVYSLYMGMDERVWGKRLRKDWGCDSRCCLRAAIIVLFP